MGVWSVNKHYNVIKYISALVTVQLRLQVVDSDSAILSHMNVSIQTKHGAILHLVACFYQSQLNEGIQKSVSPSSTNHKTFRDIPTRVLTSRSCSRSIVHTLYCIIVSHRTVLWQCMLSENVDILILLNESKTEMNRCVFYKESTCVCHVPYVAHDWHRKTQL